MVRYITLYKAICETNNITSIKGWVYLLYYPILKEIDSLLRYIKKGQDISSYDIEPVDEFYFDFCLYDDKLPSITIHEFLRILNETEYFVPSPIKKYACGLDDFVGKRLLINYHDASPCFSYCGEHFQLNPAFTTVHILNSEKDAVYRFLMGRLISEKIVDHNIVAPLKEILYYYINRASGMFPTVAQWLYPMLKHYKRDVLTDQTLAPGQCCVNHLLKSSGNKLTVLQHQKNLILSDISSILYLDFHMADRYMSWIPRDQLRLNYPFLTHSFPDSIIQRGAIDFMKQPLSIVADKIGSGRKCLYIMTFRSKKYIDGTMLDIENEECLKKEVDYLRELNYDVYLRKDPRDMNNLLDNRYNFDDSSSLVEAVSQYDICICDRPGGATVIVLEQKGFVLIKSGLDEFPKTTTYFDLLQKQQLIRNCLPIKRRKLFEMFDLLCV